MHLWLPRPLTWPFWAQLTSLGVLLALAIPWLARAYGWWWDLAYGRGAFCTTFLPLQK